ncbi:MAG: serine protease [Gammaproteobacteria bacterium]|nr:serine protease [Gammaproteobacteria bacterium]
MKKYVLFICAFFVAQPCMAIDLDQEVLNDVISSNFEVVIAKPDKDTVKYEKELPLHLLPYQVRTDKYYSVGSAFRLDNDRFITAAHVLGLGWASQHKELGIRDADGNVYAINEIYKYSLTKDFVVFTVDGIKSGPSLDINRGYTKNKKVYAVGNALGEGVVIRDGLYTSDTPEEVAGAWKWMRFSAAASPGNSGGPLLDDKGNVIGVILRKSEDENLNYALPISIAMDFDNEAELISRGIYQLEISNDTHLFNFERHHKLPMNVKELDGLLQKDFEEITEAAASGFLREHKDRMFPMGENSQPMLYSRYTSFFPGVLAQSNDGIWDMFSAEDVETSDTGDGGWLKYGKMGSFYYLRVKRPNNVSVRDFYSDSNVLMDQILKGIPYSRDVGVESIRIVSMGEADDERVHKDNFGRKWQVYSWMLGFSDQSFVLYSLPTPEGYAIMLSLTDTADAAMMEVDMKIIVNNFYLTYYGTLSEWGDFVEQKKLLPAFMEDVVISTDRETYIQYQDKYMNFRVDEKTMDITADSDIQLRCSYYVENDKVLWGPVMVAFGEDKDIADYASVSRNIQPPSDMAEQYRKRWANIIGLRTPYNGKTYMDESMSNLTIVKSKDMSSLDKNEVIYALSWHEEGTIEHKVMESKLQGFSANFKYFE